MIGTWVARPSEKTTHLYLRFRYDDFPYTLIISGQVASLIAGHSLIEPGVFVARNLFCIFGKETPDDIEELKNRAYLLAVDFLDVAFCKVMNSRKIARLQVSTEILTNLLRGYCDPVAATDAPKDLKVVSIGQSGEDVAMGRFTVWVESESLEPIPEGGVIPIVSFWYKHYLPEDYIP